MQAKTAMRVAPNQLCARNSLLSREDWPRFLTPGPSPRRGEGKANIELSSLAPPCGEAARRADEGCGPC
jgi:hypothetical protein